ncbi:hypothetical protein FH972_019284 [Carpinus fangiana]|uniref:Leucine-rich repeat-containing N-terminal plant-type domain-containing protein n=1 Tax=Carpinus fangiana TaxID=176857 RepID=A0A5N6RQ45_9ROSI|nr:hypothetical protein FH972_019284 [Carpinus fangiana]
MSDEETDSRSVALIIFLILITGVLVAGDSLDTDRDVLLNLKSFLEETNRVNQGGYSQWNGHSPDSPCDWPGIICSSNNATTRVTGIKLPNRQIAGEIFGNFSLLSELSHLDLSKNTISGMIPGDLSLCRNLYLDLSSNKFSEELWNGFPRLLKFSVSENHLTGPVLSDLFTENCSLKILDLSENVFIGGVPVEISKCRNLEILNLAGNNFTGKIPAEIGSISRLEALYLGSNNFSSVIPDSLLNLKNLTFLDLSKNNFGGDIQKIFGNFTQIRFLVLHGNSYTGGIKSSGILKLPNVLRLDLSYNNFSGSLPIEVSEMPSLIFLILAYNQFSGNIPSEYGNFSRLQALDLSFNRLNGSIPPTLGKLSSLLWLMLANNSLTGEIPLELGNCTSLLWLNLANNQLSGKIPPELTNIGRNATATFQTNIRLSTRIIAGSGECLVMKRWIPADYPPFSFVYNILTRKSCRSIWDRLLQGYGLFPKCVAGSSVRTFQISGYLQLSGNRLSGELPPDIGKMQNFTMLHLGSNDFYGKIPPQIGQMPLVVLNISRNNFLGEIPKEIGDIKCLQNLDLSWNNFSDTFPASLDRLTELSKFNISYNPFISGTVPATRQFATFEKDSYHGDPLLQLPKFMDNSTDDSPKSMARKPKRRTKWAEFLAILTKILAFLIAAILLVMVFLLVLSAIVLIKI